MKIRSPIADKLVAEEVHVAWGIRSTDCWVMSNIHEFILLDPRLSLSEVEELAKVILALPLARELTEEQRQQGYSYCEIHKVKEDIVSREEALKAMPYLQKIFEAKKRLEELEKEYKKTKEWK